MNKILYVLFVVAMITGLAAFAVPQVSAAQPVPPPTWSWLPWQGCTPNGSPGQGCWKNDCNTWILSPVTAVSDSTGVWIKFDYTIGDFSTGPHFGHITVGVDGSFAQPTYSQAANDTVDPATLFTGTVLDDMANVPTSGTYNKHFNVPAGSVITVYFGQEGCGNCAKVDPVTVPPYNPPHPYWFQVWACKVGNSCFNFGVHPGPDKLCFIHDPIYNHDPIPTSAVYTYCHVDPAYADGFVEIYAGWRDTTGMWHIEGYNR